MRNLLNFIFANLIPIVVVVSIALRIIGGVKSHARKKQPPQTPGDFIDGQEDEEEYSGVWDRLKPDEEAPPNLASGKDSGASHDAGGVYPPVRDIRPLLMPALSPLPRSGPAPSSLFSPAAPLTPPLFTPETPPFELETVIEPEIEAKREGPGERPSAAFFRRLEKLPPLRRAVILAEILGPPRGLSNSPAAGRG
jgi:hypothetical protein